MADSRAGAVEAAFDNGEMGDTGMSERIGGRAAVVTGCSSGIGFAITERFLEEGAFVLGFDLQEGAAAGLASDRFRLHLGSVSDEPAFDAAFDALMEWTGRLDIMVNNAGVQFEATLDEAEVDQLDRLLAVNLRGVFLGTRLAARRMGRGGSIINLGSVLGQQGGPGVARVLRIEERRHQPHWHGSRNVRARGHPGELHLPGSRSDRFGQAGLGVV